MDIVAPFFFAFTISDASQYLNTLLAYSVLTIGPFVGAYMFIKNANKMFSAANGLVNKASKWGQKKSNSWAKSKYDRSAYGVGRALKREARDNVAKQRAISKLEGGKGLRARIGRGFIRGDARKAFDTRLSGAMTGIYDKEVDDETKRLAMTKYGLTPQAAQDYLEKVIREGGSTAQVHAATNNLLAQKTGKSRLRSVFDNTALMQKAAQNEETYDGLERGAARNSGFMNAHADVANMLTQHNGEAKERFKAGKSISDFLGSNFNNTSTVTYSDGTSHLVADKAKGAKSWDWISKRSGQVLQASEAHTGHMYKDISYDAAVAAKSDTVAFGGSDPGIQDMINAIIAAGPPPAGSTLKNLVPTYTPGVATNPDWINWST